MPRPVLEGTGPLATTRVGDGAALRGHATEAAPAARPTVDADVVPPAAFRPGDTVGRYRIRDLLATGGMGQVFTADDVELGRTVALKLVRPDGRGRVSRARTRLLREAQALARLQHPNVVTIYDVGTEGDQVFIAMELVGGPTLAEWLASSPRPWRAVRDVFLAAGHGLAAAHAVGLVHRDFKPSNVILGAHRVVVVDFGLARIPEGGGGAGDRLSTATMLDVDLTLTGERVGTPRYMAPEQHAGHRVSALADQFAFATSMWAALYGIAPFAGQTSAEVLHEMNRGPAAPPPDRKVPERVRAALARALAVQPRDRWPSLADLLGEIANDPTAARRRRAVLGVAAALILAVVATAFSLGRTAATSEQRADVRGVPVCVQLGDGAK